MSAPAFTPGPWGKPQPLPNALKLRIDCQRSGAIADVWGLNEEAVANANLITAAPELYEALERAVAVIEAERAVAVDSFTIRGGAAKGTITDPDDLAIIKAMDAAIDVARAALAKAGGEA